MGVKTICNFVSVRTKNNSQNCACVYNVFLKVTSPDSFTEFSGEINIVSKQ